MTLRPFVLGFGAVLAVALGGRGAPAGTAPVPAGAEEVLVVLRETGAVRRGDLPGRRRSVAARLQRVLGRVDPAAVRPRRVLGIAGAFTAEVTPAGAAQLRADPDVEAVGPAETGRAALGGSVVQIRADAVHAWDSTGRGVTVAVLDAGVDATHPDLADAVVGEACFCADRCCPNGRARQEGAGAAASLDAHGSHVAGVIAARGRVAPAGVAPDARLVAVKVLGPQLTGAVADWLAALEWILETRPEVGVVNMSLETEQTYPGPCDTATATTRALGRLVTLLRDRGVPVVAAAGNSGATGGLAAPACLAPVIAVGAVSRADRVLSFSNSDRTLDLLAPGSSIVSVRAGGATRTLSGTSVAAPHVTGVIALLLGRAPAATPDALDAALATSDTWVVDARNGLVRPRLNARAAMAALDRMTVPVLGGGSRRTDCLLTWQLPPSSTGVPSTAPGTVCRDNDAECDADPRPGWCGFEVTACFNTPDRRVPHCDTGATIADLRVSWPRATAEGDPVARANAAAVAEALPGVPLAGRECGAPFVVRVPAGGASWVRVVATTEDEGADGPRRDADRLRFRCLGGS